MQQPAAQQFDLVTRAWLVVDDEVVEPVRSAPRGHRRSRVPDRCQLGRGHLQRALAGLVGGAEREVASRPPGHLHVAAEHVGHPPGPGECDQAVHRGQERGEVGYVQPPGIDGVPGEQDAGPRVVDRDRRVLVARRAQHLEHPPAQVEGHGPLRPAVAEPEERPHRARVRRHHRGPGPPGELSVRGHVVTVPVGVRHDQPVALARVPGQPDRDQPVDLGAQREPLGIGGRPGVEQQRPVVAEQQEHERRLVVDTLALPQDDGVLVVVVDLDLRLAVASPAGRPVVPRDVQRPRDGRPARKVDHWLVSNVVPG